MSDATKIEWADSTFNPWEGCTKISVGPKGGCAHCYAETRNGRYAGGTPINWGPGAPRRRTSPQNWAKPLQWERQAAAFQAECGRRRRVFCASLADVFDNEVDPAWRADLFDLIRRTPSLEWLLLTKRVGNVRAMVEAAGGWPENAALGFTVCNQDELERDGPKAIEAKRALKPLFLFGSFEPLLGAIDLERPMPGPDLDQGGGRTICQPWYTQGGIDWVIVGGESGSGARPMHPDWTRSMRDQCVAAGVPFLFKQWGEWGPIEDVAPGRIAEGTWVPIDGSGPTATNDLSAETDYCMSRFGKKAAGRLLDGVEHNGFPAA